MSRPDNSPIRPTSARIGPGAGTIIVGGGLAAAKTAEALRSKGYDGRVTIVGAEAHPPYERPGLSKGHLMQGRTMESLRPLTQQWYADHDVHLTLGTPVRTIDPAAGLVQLADDRTLTWEHLVLATGASPRRLRLPGAELDGVHHLRTWEDSTALRAELALGPDVVTIGGGWIGLECAAAARFHGCAVTVLDQEPWPMAATLGHQMAEFLMDAHRCQGVDVRGGVQVARLLDDSNGAVRGVELADGSVIPATVVVVGIGAIPNVGPAEAALTIDNGIVVDEHLRAASHVYAVGDVANAWHPTLEQQVRVEHWDTAVHQPVVAAAGIVGERAVYDRLPTFFSDQYDIGLEFVGLLERGRSYDIVLRGDQSSGAFVAFWRRGVRVVAAMTVNTWGITEDLAALVRTRTDVSGSRLADPDVPIRELVPAARACASG